MNKKVLSLVAIIALVAILAVCLVACNSDSYAKKLEKAGYTVSVYSEDQIEEDFGEDADIEFAIYAIKTGDGNIISKIGNALDGDMGYVIKYANKDDAKDAAAKAEEAGTTVKRIGKIVIAGSEQFVKDAK